MPGISQTGTLNQTKKPICVIGLGYVGLPLAVELANAGYDVVGFDIDETRINELRLANDRNKSVSSATLEKVNYRLSFTFQEASIADCGVFIIAVPTPVDSRNDPDLSMLRAACATVGKNLSPGSIVVFESTVYPGCTEDFCIPLIEVYSGGKKEGKDFFVGYSPERVNPGDAEHGLRDITKLVACPDGPTLIKLTQIYSSVTNVWPIKSIKVAEAAKAIENAQRDINIAFVNELAMVFSKMGIDTKEVLEAARTKWNFLDFRPGLVGGHCIGVDPYYLAYRAQEFGYYPEIILAGRRVNESVAPFVASRLMKAMAGFTNPKVLILGTTFKEDCPDTRNSKVEDLIEELNEFGCKVSTYDPMVYRSLMPDGPWDGIVVAVAHQEFRARTFNWARLKQPYTVLYDLKGVVPDEFVDLRL